MCRQIYQKYTLCGNIYVNMSCNFFLNVMVPEQEKPKKKTCIYLYVMCLQGVQQAKVLIQQAF